MQTTSALSVAWNEWIQHFSNCFKNRDRETERTEETEGNEGTEGSEEKDRVEGTVGTEEQQGAQGTEGSTGLAWSGVNTAIPRDSKASAVRTM